MISLDNTTFYYVQDLKKITEAYRIGDFVIAWKKEWVDSGASVYKKHPAAAEIIGIYGKIIRTDLGDYTAWDLIKAEEAFKRGGYNNYV